MVERPADYPQPGVTAFSRASSRAVAVDDADREADWQSAAGVQRGVLAVLRSVRFVGASPHLRADAAARHRRAGGPGVRVCALPDVADRTPAGLVRVLDAARADGAPLVLRRSPAAVADSLRRVVADAGSGLRLLPVLSVDVDRALAHLVRRRPRAVVAYCARDRDVGRRGAGHGADRLRLPEVPACVWLAPLAGGDRVFQCRHRQRAQGVRLALDLGLARRRRASGVGAVSGPGDRGRGAHRRHAGVGGGGPIRFRSARRVAMAARGVGGVRSGGHDAGIFRSVEDRTVRREADLGEHGPQTTVSRCTAGCRRACPSSFRPPCLAQAIAARVLHDCDGRDVAVQPRTIADADERDADLQGALRLADAVARGRGRASAGAVLGPQHLVPGGGRRPCRGADHDALAAAAHVAARSRLRARRCRSVADAPFGCGRGRNRGRHTLLQSRGWSYR